MEDITVSQDRTFEFTDRALKGLPVPPKDKPEKVWNEDAEEWEQPPYGQVDYFDAKARGLGLRISYGGRKSFFAMYSNSAGKRQRVSLGEYGQLEHGKLSLAEARKRAKARLGEVAKDQDPAAQARTARAALTVRQLAADFIEIQHKQARKTAADQERMLAHDVLPAIGDRKVRDLTRADIKSIMDKITRRGSTVMANRVHEVVRTMLNFGIEEEIYGLESNPADRLGKHRNPEQRRDRWLSLDEIRDYWTALDSAPTAGTAALRLCLLTAQRQQNVLGMRLDQLSLADRLWIIPARTTKTGKPYKMPLSAAAVTIIEARIAELENTEQNRAKREHREHPEPVTWLFPKRSRLAGEPIRSGGGPAGRTFTFKVHRAACKRAGISNYRPHDHRHTFATHCEQMGISRLIWDGIMGHAQNGMADLYSGYDFAEQRLECMERWADRIAATLSDNVVPLKQDITA